MGTLQSKTIVVTGGSLGIGLAIAKKISSEGGRVVLAARNKNDLNNALLEIKTISPSEHLLYQVDVGNFSEVKKFSSWCKDKVGRIDGLVNCAGIYGPIGKSTMVDLNAFTEAIKINFLGTVYMCHFFYTVFTQGAKNKIVNFSGGGAATPFPNYSAYATSKIAIVRFTENLALELMDDNFDVNCVAPGFVVTRLHKQTMAAGPELSGKGFFEGTIKQIETGGVAPEKAADLTNFLLSDKSDGITGKFISAPWDPWYNEEFQDLLRKDKDFATLRRIDNKTFYKKI